ncbi:MAG TPA: hypothetical protein VL221_02195 [Bacteroidota bacterium]|nr:hypothetical protein [Bacteroidota bacterium]
MKTPPAQVPAGLLQSHKRYPGVDVLYHVAYYHAARVGYQDIVSRSLHDFKDGCEPQTSRWIALAAPRVCKDLKFDVIVRALGTSELKASTDTPLDRLCEAIAGGSGATYAPERLEKSRAVRAMTSLGGRVARQKELEGCYAFDGTGLNGGSRILVVDDIATTGATLEAVDRAIATALPGATITCFVLARVEAQLQNTHIDPAYFIKGAPADAARETVKAPQADSRRTSARAPMADPARSSVRRPSAEPVTASVRMQVAPDGVAMRPASDRVNASGGSPLRETDSQRLRRVPAYADIQAYPGRTPVVDRIGRVSRGLHTRFYVIGLVLSLLLLGATVLIPVKKEPPPPTSQFVQLVNQNAIKSPDPIPERRAPQPLPEGKPAVVTVPSMGLRSSHSMESRIIPREIVRLKERVEILRRFSSATGPDWFQVKTKSGAIGWVIASVIRELRG